MAPVKPIGNTARTLAIRKSLGPTSHRMAMELSRRHGTVVTHTGNLDPMAEGVMVFLIGREAIRNQAKWQAADKTYEFQVLFGVFTDTQDQLGMVLKSKDYDYQSISKDRLTPLINEWTALRSLERPVYSYKLIRGKPLYWWARRGRLNEITVPEAEVRIRSVEFLDLRTLTKKALGARLRRNIARVEGDFRQKAILDCWEETLDRHPNSVFSVARIRVACGKGTYVRALAHRLGGSLGIPSVALRILRTRVGSMRLADCSSLSGGALKISNK